MTQRCASTRFVAALAGALAVVCLLSTCVGPGSDIEPSVDRKDSDLSVPTGFVDETVVTGLANPTAMEFAPDGRLFVCQQGGALRVIKNGALLPTPFLSLTVDSSGERGLLGITFDPAFPSNGYVYVYYTTPAPSVHNRLSRFTASGDVSVAGSEQVILDLEPLSSATVHNGGALHFGLDGKLYVAVGENSQSSNSQTLSNRLGKMLRVNPDGTIPADNPFYSTAAGVNRAIWALGLRNPFTFAVQPTSGTLFINDVGQVTWEEINLGVPGANYGWPTTEGPTTDPAFVSPLFSYGHGSTLSTGCAIAGGTFYNPSTGQFPASYVGKYFFSDYCGGWIRVLDPATRTAVDFAAGISSPVDLDVAADGTLYYLARATGAVGRIRASVPGAPQITTQPQSLRRTAGQSATFTVGASGATPLSYQWQRNGSNIAGASAASYLLSAVSAGDNGAQFRAVVTNASGSATSDIATLTIVPGAPPVPTIIQPAQGASYVAGQTYPFSGTATDPDDGALPFSAYSWEIFFHHDTHTHPFLAPTTGVSGGSFLVPNRGETSANVFFRIHLTVTDSTGVSASTFRDFVPRTSLLTLQTVPPGLQVTLDGQSLPTPVSVPSVVGLIRALGVVSPQAQNGSSYSFSAWSDGGAASHEIPTPPSSATYTATFATSSNVIPAGGATVTGTTSGSSAFTGGCASASGSAPERVFRWTPSASGSATIHTCSTQVRFDTVLYVSGSANASAQLACNDDTSGCATGDGSANAGSHGSRVTLQVVAGQPYYLFVDGYAGSSGGSQGQFALTVVPPTAAVDGGSADAAADAGTSDASSADSGGSLPVIPPGGGTVEGSTSGASTSSGSCAASASGAAPEQVFSWTPNGTGTATISTCSPQVTFDTVVYARSAPSGGQELACNDDTSGCATGDGSGAASSHGSKISLSVVAGQTYYVVVDGYAGSSGGAQGSFTLTVVAPPATPDAGVNLPVIAPEGGVVYGTTSGSSATSGSCASSATSQAPEQMYQWTAPRSGQATASTCGAAVEFDTVLYARNAPSGGQQLACNDDTSGCATGDGSSTADHHGSRIAFNVSAGQTYYLVVDGYAGSPGGSQGQFALTVAPPP